MNKDLFIDGEKYISAKRAGENLGYSADYIGQLARSGAVAGKMIGRTWYVSRKSLLGYRKDAQPERRAQVGRPALGKKDIYINGEKFVSSISAASETGYTTDYIGQLVRSGAIAGKMMGRTWYVSRRSLLPYKKNNSVIIRPQPAKTPAPVAKRTASALQRPLVRPALAPVAKPISFVSETVVSLPALSKVRIAKTYPLLMRNVVSLSLSLIIIAGVSYSWLGYLSPSTADSVDIKVAETMDSIDGFKEATGARLAQLTKPFRVGTSYAALTLSSGIKSFFTGVLSGILPVPKVTTELAQQPAAGSSGEGVVVSSETGDHASAVERIKAIFSDQVSVSSDADGASGIITPVWRSSTSSDKYTYVLVPIKPAK